ncbi:MAG: XRE family transcriptional regulator [Candidatus Methylumidiphilus sp.]
MSFQTLESYPVEAEKAESQMAHEEDPIARSIGKVLHNLRKQRELSLNDLARLSGVSRSMLSQMETGRSIPSVVVLCKIARTFDVPVTVFLGTETLESPFLVRGKETLSRVSAGGKCTWRTLTEIKRERKFKFYEISLRGGGVEKVSPHPPTTKAILAVSTGHVLLDLDGQSHRLHEGDVFEFPACVAHTYINPTHEYALLYLILQLPHSF